MPNQQRSTRSVIPLQSNPDLFEALPATELLRRLHQYIPSAPTGSVVGLGTDAQRLLEVVAQAFSDQGSTITRNFYCLDAYPQSVVQTTRASSAARIVDLPDAQLSGSWREPIALLVVSSGDEEQGSGVLERLQRWLPHVQAGGYLVLLSEGGRAQAYVASLVGRRVLRSMETLEGATFLQKMQAVPAQVQSRPVRRLLVCCETLSAGPELQRFVSLGNELKARGNSLAIAHIASGQQPCLGEKVECMTLDSARQRRWDALMVVGEAFSEQGLAALATLRGPQYGVRVQHVLDSSQRRERYLQVNRAVDPQVVVFDNRHWTSGSYIELNGDRFYTLEGAVDCRHFAPLPYRAAPCPDRPILLAGRGGQAAQPLITALRHLPSHVELELLGGDMQVEGHEDLLQSGRLRLLPTVPHQLLAAYYHRWDIVIHPQSHSGFSDMVAEAMASGVPVICTSAGTRSLAHHEHTALCLNRATPQAIAQAVRRLMDEPGLATKLSRAARQRTYRWSFQHYADRLQNMLFRDQGAHFLDAPELGIYGKWPLAAQLHGLEPLWARVAGERILDLSCGEGVIARRCYERGAKVVWGFDREACRIEKARELCKHFRYATFQHMDPGCWPSLHAEHRHGLDQGADVTLQLSEPDHLAKDQRRDLLAEILKRTRKLFVLRCTAARYHDDQIELQLSTAGFALVEAVDAASFAPSLGALWYFERVRPAPEEPTEAPSTRGAPSPLPYRPLPNTQRQTNQYVVSFPMSGRTWLRYALSLMGVSQVSFDHDGYDMSDPRMPAPDHELQRRRIRFNGCKVIYLERDPRDVMVSCYKHITGRFADLFRYQGTCSDFIRDPRFGACRLQAFRELWDGLCAEGLAQKLTYEELHRDFAAGLAATLHYLQIPHSPAAVAAASKSADIRLMRAVEQRGAFCEPWLRARNGHTTVRAGKVGSHIDELCAADIAYLNSQFQLPPLSCQPR